MKRKKTRYVLFVSIAISCLGLFVAVGVLFFWPVSPHNTDLPASMIYNDLLLIRAALIESGYEPDSTKILVSLDTASRNGVDAESINSKISAKHLLAIKKRDWHYVVPEHLIGKSWSSLNNEELVVVVIDTGYVKRAGIRRDYVIVYESK